MAQPIDEEKSLSQDEQLGIKISIPSQSRLKACPDLLKGSRKDYITTGIPLYEASVIGDWKTAKKILDIRPELIRYSLTENGETALHVAASAKSTKQLEDFVKNLITYMEKADLELENNSSNTALCLAAAAGNVKMVKFMVDKNRALVAITGSQAMPPLYMAALFGHYKVVKYLYENSQKLRDECWTPQNRGWILQKCIESDMFDIAVKIVREHPDLRSNGSVLGTLAQKTDAFRETESNIIMRTINWVIRPKKQALEKQSKDNALELLTTIWRNIAEKPKKEIDSILRGPRDLPIKQHDDIVKMQKNKESATATSLDHAKVKYSSRILFVAVERGNTRFIVELIRQYPDLVWKVNDDNQSIFHMAARHRQVDIYNLLHETCSKDLITPLKDKNDDTMLHVVARSVERKRNANYCGSRK